MFKKNILLAALISVTGFLHVISPLDEVHQGISRRELVVRRIQVAEKLVLRFEKTIEQLLFVEWAVSLKESVNRSYAIVTDLDGHISVVFDEACKFIFKYNRTEFSETVIEVLSACQDSELRQEVVAKIEEYRPHKLQRLDTLALLRETLANDKKLLEDDKLFANS